MAIKGSTNKQKEGAKMKHYQNTCVANHAHKSVIFGRFRTWLWWKRHDRCNPV
jgi:Fe-S cluster assembly scaffold protein SufB